MHPNQLIKYLGEPGTGEPVELAVTETSNGVPYRGWLLNSKGETVGRLVDFKYDFVHFETPPTKEDFKLIVSKETAPQKKSVFIDPHDPRFQYIGEWHDIGDYMRVAFGGASDTSVSIRSKANRVDILLHSHQWSGIAAIFVNGRIHETIDLYANDNPLTCHIQVEKPENLDEMTILVRQLGIKNNLSNDGQLIIEGAVEHLDELEMPEYKALGEVNHGGGQFLEAFYEYLKELPADAVVLDVGGGKRQLNDERYINLEYSQYDEANLFGDAQVLPFKSNSVDLIYCSGVLEHVPDILKSAREIHRVLKTGGRALVLIPFIQPLHNEPQHFFNATPFGVEYAFSQFTNKTIICGGDPFGNFKWIFELAHFDKLAEPEEWQELLRLTEKLSKQITPDRLKYVAPLTYLNAVKD